MMHPVFKNVKLQNRFNEKGYLTMPLVTNHEINILNKFYDDIAIEFGLGRNGEKILFGAQTSPELFRIQFEKIVEIFEPIVEKYFEDYKIWQGQFMVKLPGCQELHTHIHPSVVDEKKYTPMGIWLPLNNSDEKNGGLRVVPNSNEIFKCLYPRPFDPGPFEFFEKFNDYIKENNLLETIRLNKGEAVLFEESLLHSSFPNNSSDSRIAISVFLIPKQAELFYFKALELKGKRKIGKYKILDQSYFIGQWDNKNLLGEPEIVSAPKHNLSKSEFAFLIRNHRMPKNNFERLKSFILGDSLFF